MAQLEPAERNGERQAMTFLHDEDRAGFFGFFREMREGLRRQTNVIFALIFKEIKKRTGSDGYGMYSLIGNILEPTIATVTMMVFFYLIRRQEVYGVHVALFIAVSYIPFGILRRSLSNIPAAVKSNSAFYAYQQVKPFDSIVARFVLQSALLLLGGMLILFLLWWFLGLHVRTDRLPQAIGVIAMMMASALGISLIVGTYGTIYPAVNRIISTLSRGIVILCAVIHPMRDLQARAGSVLLWNPLAHMEELIRYYALGMKPYLGVSLSFCILFMLSCLGLGFAAYYANRLELLKR